MTSTLVGTFLCRLIWIIIFGSWICLVPCTRGESSRLRHLAFWLSSKGMSISPLPLACCSVNWILLSF